MHVALPRSCRQPVRGMSGTLPLSPGLLFSYLLTPPPSPIFICLTFDLVVGFDDLHVPFFALCFCHPDSATPFGSITLLRLIRLYSFFPFFPTLEPRPRRLDFGSLLLLLCPGPASRIYRRLLEKSTAASSCSLVALHSFTTLLVDTRLFEAKRFPPLTYKDHFITFSPIQRQPIIYSSILDEIYCKGIISLTSSPSCRLRPPHPPFLPLTLVLLPITIRAVHRARAPSPNNRRTRSGNEPHKINWSRWKMNSSKTLHPQPQFASA